MKISVVIPVYREDAINTLLDDLLRRPDLQDTEILVVDGAPDHDTLLRISCPQIITLPSPAGRAVQQNTGASAASGDVLLFLHADTLLPPGAFDLIRRELTVPELAGGAFRLSYGDTSRACSSSPLPPTCVPV